MSDATSYSSQIAEGKKIVTDYVASLPANVTEMRWLPRDLDLDAFSKNLWRLELFLGDDRKVINFPEEHLADAPGTPGGDRILKQRVDQFIRGLVRE